MHFISDKLNESACTNIAKGITVYACTMMARRAKKVEFCGRTRGGNMNNGCNARFDVTLEIASYGGLLAVVPILPVIENKDAISVREM